MTRFDSNSTLRALRQDRRHLSNHGWLQSHASLSYADGLSANQIQFSSLLVVNEDIVSPKSGFRTHAHSEFEIFTYVISGQLTHRDSISGSRVESLHRGHVQFTTAGTGIAHAEANEHATDDLHFLQIWVKPWKRELKPRYHARHFNDTSKRKAFVTIISPLAAGPGASDSAEAEAQPMIPGTVPIHADCFMGAGLVQPGSDLTWTAGAHVAATDRRRIFLHVVMKDGARVKVEAGAQELTLDGGDGAFIEDINTGSSICVISLSNTEAEVIVLDMF